MKKLLLVGCVLLMFSASYAQVEDTQSESKLLSKRGYSILPESGDFGIGFDAVPFLQYGGNFFSGSTNTNSVNADFQNSTQQLVGKYFLDEKTAIRARFRFRSANDTDRNSVILDNQATPDPNVKVIDERSINSNFIQIGAGYEKRRGQGRLYGIYGGEISVFSSKTKTNFEYGNPTSVDNQFPTTTTNFGFSNDGSQPTARTVEQLSGRNLGFGLDGFAGIEYFFAPKNGFKCRVYLWL